MICIYDSTFKAICVSEIFLSMFYWLETLTTGSPLYLPQDKKRNHLKLLIDDNMISMIQFSNILLIYKSLFVNILVLNYEKQHLLIGSKATIGRSRRSNHSNKSQDIVQYIHTWSFVDHCMTKDKRTWCDFRTVPIGSLVFMSYIT